MKYLIAGLGNIGPEYELTRHNAGFLCLDQLADKHDVKFELDRYAFKSEFKHKGRIIHIIKPTTYMNISGKAVRYWLDKLKIPVSRLLVVVDDVALPFGTIRIRAGGSAAGHNGLINIETLLKTRDYPRLRIGIGDDFPKGRQVEYVLSRFGKEEIEELPAVFDKACEAIDSFSVTGLERTMNFFNKKQ